MIRTSLTAKAPSGPRHQFEFRGRWSVFVAAASVATLGVGLGPISATSSGRAQGSRAEFEAIDYLGPLRLKPRTPFKVLSPIRLTEPSSVWSLSSPYDPEGRAPPTSGAQLETLSRRQRPDRRYEYTMRLGIDAPTGKTTEFSFFGTDMGRAASGGVKGVKVLPGPLYAAGERRFVSDHEGALAATGEFPIRLETDLHRRRIPAASLTSRIGGEDCPLDFPARFKGLRVDRQGRFKAATTSRFSFSPELEARSRDSLSGRVKGPGRVDVTLRRVSTVSQALAGGGCSERSRSYLRFTLRPYR